MKLISTTFIFLLVFLSFTSRGPIRNGIIVLYFPDTNKFEPVDSQKVKQENGSLLKHPFPMRRQTNSFDNLIIKKYFSVETLTKLIHNDPGKIKLIEYYFDNSYFFEPIEFEGYDQELVMEFVETFDPYLFENKRSDFSRTPIEFPEVGIKVILLAKNELPEEIRNYFKKIEIGSKRDFGRAMPLGVK